LIVVGHNVYHIVPNEVPILFAVGWISLHVRDGGWKATGLRKPDSWSKTVLWALLAAALIVVLSDVVVGPIAEKFLGAQHGSKGLETSTPNLLLVLEMLALIWTFAAFGEEMGYRGYLMTRAAEVGNRSTVAYVAALIVVSILSLWIWTLLQRTGGSDRIHRFRPGSWGRLPSFRAQPVGCDSRARLQRHVRSPRGAHWVEELARGWRN
jgi:membrane protease YdiL (CAAX protease family)